MRITPSRRLSISPCLRAPEEIETKRDDRVDDRESLQSEVNTENHPPPLAALWSRDVASDRLAGRPRTILSLRRAMSEIGAVEHLRLSNMIEQQRLGATLWAICTAAGE